MLPPFALNRACAYPMTSTQDRRLSLDWLVQAGEASDVVLEYLDGATGNFFVSSAWGQLSEKQQAELRGIGTILSVVVPISRIRMVGQSLKAIRKLPFSDNERIVKVNEILDRVESGGPFHYKRDGIVFENREGKLPTGNYREYTVESIEQKGRGSRRVLIDVDTGKAYYTDDHYNSFVQIDPEKTL